MLLTDGYHEVPAGKLAAVVTYLEMRARPALRVRPAARLAPEGAQWSFRRVDPPSVDWYTDLYRRVGADWLWSSRLELAEEQLAAIIGDVQVECHALVHEGRDVGLLELDFRVPEECEIAYFGLTPAMVGRGAGRALMDHAIALAWSRPIRRLWLHTCTLDSPGALAFYLRSGFTPYASKVEVYDDPRTNGTLPREAAPQVPIIGRDRVSGG